ncbi:MAG: glycosyltransferase family 2 protein [Phycisphaerales bacterium]|nr:glycosyltransferase family 2 protein [Phycisphaerales bacterium]
MGLLTFILFFVWALAMVFSIWAFEAARMFARRCAKAKNLSVLLPNPVPSIALILPVKSVEEDTAENLRALLKLTYPRLRILFAVESQTDPVVSLLNTLTAELPSEKYEIVIAGRATVRGQKIHNQLAAVARTTAADDILVFMDADARPHDRWLPALIESLAYPNAGASTGYRLYVPSLRQPSSLLASAQVSVINATIAALLGPAKRNQAWGGSMAITRQNFFDLGIHGAWQNALSDDYVLTLQIKRVHKKEIHFTHACLVPSSATFTWHSFFEFAPRQYKITKVCSPWIWLTALAGSALYALAFTYPLILWTLRLFIGPPDHWLLVMLAALYITNLLRGFFLLQGSKTALPEHAGKLQTVAFWYTWAFPLALFINLFVLLKSAFGRTIQWRGITYRLDSATKTTILSPSLPLSPSPPLDRELHTAYKVWTIEKLIINFAMPMDFVYHTFRAIFQRDKSQTGFERLIGLWSGKVAKYQKLLRVKDEMGHIPDDWRAICMQTPCGKTRYFLANLANINRRRPRHLAKPTRPLVSPPAPASE